MKVKGLVAEINKIFYLQAPVSNLVAIMVVLLFSYLLADEFGTSTVAWWAGAAISAAGIRLVLWWMWQYREAHYPPEIWLRLYMHASILLALGWGLLFTLAPESMSNESLSALLMLYFGLGVATYASLSVHLLTYTLYFSMPTLGLLYLLVLQGGPKSVYLVPAVGLFFLLMFLFAVNNSRIRQKAIGLELGNKGLITQLQKEVEQRDRMVFEKTAQLTTANQALERSERQLRNVIFGASLGYWDWNYQTGAHEVNDRWLDILGLDRSDIDNDVGDWAARIHPDDEKWMIELVEAHIQDRTPYVAEFRMRHKDGHWVWIQGAGAVVEYDAADKPLRLCGTHQEIDDRKLFEQRLQHQAMHDALTGLLNRSQLWVRLEEELLRAERYSHPLSVFMVDIDHFKSINDDFGHAVGDKVLKDFAAMLKREMRATDVILRYGGEEFIVILPETGLGEALGLADRVRLVAAAQGYTAAGQTYAYTASIGVAAYPLHGENAEVLVDSADKSLYRAKSGGRNRVVSKA